jgi:hypothetical protein
MVKRHAKQKMPKPSRPRDKRPPLTQITYSVEEYSELTGLSTEAVLRSVDEGSLR